MPSDAEKMPMVPMNSFTGMPRSTCTFLKTSSASGGRAGGLPPQRDGGQKADRRGDERNTRPGETAAHG
jgi:hypothetical protein